MASLRAQGLPWVDGARVRQAGTSPPPGSTEGRGRPLARPPAPAQPPVRRPLRSVSALPPPKAKPAVRRSLTRTGALQSASSAATSSAVAESAGVWSVSSSTTSTHGCSAIIRRCSAGLMAKSCAVATYARGTPSSAPSGTRTGVASGTPGCGRRRATDHSICSGVQQHKLGDVIAKTLHRGLHLAASKFAGRDGAKHLGYGAERRRRDP